jgi:hypothetical protein
MPTLLLPVSECPSVRGPRAWPRPSAGNRILLFCRTLREQPPAGQNILQQPKPIRYNWTGQALVCQRSQLAALTKRPEVRRTGVYMLVGPDPEHAGKDRVYIGEGDSVLERLTAHDKDASKDFWTQVVLFISKDENLTKAHGRYLERALIEMAKAMGRATLANANHPDMRLLPEPDIADMTDFLEQIQLLLPVLGFTFLQPVPTPEQLLSAPEDATVSPLFIMTPVGTNAIAREYQGEFIVLQGSTARKEGTLSWTSYRQLRDQLVQEGHLKLDGDGHDLTP